MRSVRSHNIILFILFPLFVCFPIILLPRSVQAQEVARLESANGSVEAKLRGESEFKLVTIGTVFKAQDTIRTNSTSRAAILFVSGTILRLAPGTIIQFQGSAKSDTTPSTISMSSGIAHFFERESKELPQIETPAVTTAVRGTEFIIKVNSTSTEVSVLNGLVECKNSFGTLLAQDKEVITTKLGEAPIKSILVDPLDAVQWTLFYPALLSPHNLNPSAGREDLVKAQALLSSGQVSEANIALDRASQEGKSLTNPKEQDELNAFILAQRSVISTVKNEKILALSLAQQSWKLNNNISSALANAYALQAASRLEEAKQWLDRALIIDPSNSFVLARQAELNLGFGNIEQALEQAKKAVEISPTDAYALSVMGFVYMITDKRELAIECFNQAMQHAPGLGLPHLGYGLTLIRTGDIRNGQKQIEMAVALEPNMAIYRSYLGKAFFEEDREFLALKEYDHAIALDDQDPSPFLYRAFSQLSANKPVAALRDVEKSIELNNNRAVYRSSFMLDQDLGVRSAGLSEVFTNLGFSQAARIEAIKSINHDYANYSAHRLLSGSYNTIFLNDAGLAETKLATLLAPLSFNLYSQGSSVASFNEYNSLFDRDQSRYDLSGEYQSDDNIFSEEIRAAGKKENFGYLLSFDSLSTDEPGVNNDSSRHHGRAALQYQPNYQDLFLIDSSTLYRKATNSYEAPDSTHVDDFNLDLGYRHSFNPANSLIFETTLADQYSRYITHSSSRDVGLIQEAQGQIDQSIDNLLIDDYSKERVRSVRNTAQWIFDSEMFSLVTGTQIYAATPHRSEQSPVLDDVQGVFSDIGYSLESSGFNHLYSTDFYSYSTWHLAPWVDASAGASFTQVELEERELTPFLDNTYFKSHLSPKAGFTFYPSNDLTIRSAFFETLRKSSLEDQASLEPTLVGGINQRFTDYSGDLGRTLGAGADYKLAASTYIGLEGIRRHVVDDIRPAISTVALNYDTATATNDVSLFDPSETHQDQNIIRTYLYQVFSDRVVATLNNEWTKFERTDPDYPQNLDLDKTALGLRYMDPSGWYLLSEVTQRHQRRVGSDFVEDGSDNFWLVDAALGYRLPARQGALELKLGNIFDKKFSYDQSIGLEDYVRSDFNVMLAFTLRR